MRKIWMQGGAAAVLMSLAACGGGGGSGGQADTEATAQSHDTAQNYFPLKSDARWIYKLDDDSLVQIDALGLRQTADASSAQLSVTDAAGNLLDQTEAMATASGVSEYPSENGSAFEQAIGPVKLLTFPAEAGQSFTQLDRVFTDWDVDGDGTKDRIEMHSIVSVVGYENIDLPVGHLANVLHVRTDANSSWSYSSSNQTYLYRSVVDELYAPNIGLVRRAETDYPDGITASPAKTRTLQAYRIGDMRSEQIAPTASPLLTSGAQRAVGADIAVTFNEPVDVATLNVGWHVVDATGGVLSGHVSMVGTTAHFIPDGGWHDGVYTATLTTAVTDLVGNPLQQEVTWTITLDGVSPSVISASPADRSSDVPVLSPILLQFSEPIDPASVNIGNLLVSDGSNNLAVTTEVSGSTLTIKPMTAWPRQKTIQISLGSVKDVVGNVMQTNYTMSFRSDPGEFSYPQDLAASLGTQAVSIIDLDGDGLGDFVFTTPVNPNGALATTYVRYGRADGTLEDPVQLVTGDTLRCMLDQLTVADLDGDGRKDVVVGGSWCGWHVLRQVASRVFVVAEQSNYLVTGPISAVDLDGDGLLELVGLATLNGDTQLFVWHQDGSNRFRFSPGRVNLSVSYGNKVRVADLDGDGRADLVISATGRVTEDIIVFRQQSDGSFIRNQILTTGEGQASDFAVGDIDGDGRPDIVVAAGGNSPVYLAIFHQQPDHSFGAPEHRSSYDIPAQIALSDLNGDGRLDIVVKHSGWGHVGTYLQQADGTLSAESLYVAGYGSSELAVGDLTCDSRPDIVLDGQLLRQRTPDSGTSTASRATGMARAARMVARQIGTTSQRMRTAQ